MAAAKFFRRFWTQRHQISNDGSPWGELSKNTNFPPGGPPVLGEFGGKVEILNPNISSPKGGSDPILVSYDAPPSEELKFQSW